MLVVQKYGGTSVGTLGRIKKVARRALATQRDGHDVALVVSAMSGETNRLLELARKLHDDPNDREVDVIIATGEQVSAALMALAIRSEGGDALSFLGHQIKLRTDAAHARARIVSITADKVHAAFKKGRIAVIAGFQGVDRHGNITTLGRGGSDTTAVAVAAALGADACEIYTDVDGVYTADPNVVPLARKIERISFEEMLELSSLGAKVLQIRSVEMGMKHGVPIHVRSSFHDKPGTWVVPEDPSMEKVVVAGVSADKSEAKVTVYELPDEPGVASKIFAVLSDNGVVVDMIIQNVAPKDRSETALTFTVPRTDLARTLEILETRCGRLCGNGEHISTDEAIAKISVVGVGMRSHAGVAGKMFSLLATEGINIQMISTSEIRISVVVEQKYAELAVRVLHTGFGLDAAEPE